MILCHPIGFSSVFSPPIEQSLPPSRLVAKEGGELDFPYLFPDLPFPSLLSQNRRLQVGSDRDLCVPSPSLKLRENCGAGSPKVRIQNGTPVDLDRSQLVARFSLPFPTTGEVWRFLVGFSQPLSAFPFSSCFLLVWFHSAL